MIELEISQKHISKARALIDKAAQKMPKCEEFQIMAVELERGHSNKKEAIFALSKALKNFPKSPQIWSIAIELEPENTRKKKASSAIEACGQSGWINSSVGKLFWKENKLEKAKKWLEEALKLSPNNGDVWALYIRLLETHYAD
jgi:pre-mRNA-processing factor 6